MTTLLKRALATGASLALLAPVSPGLAQAPPSLTAEVRASVIERAAESLARAYVEADTGRMIGDLLRRRLADGAYDRFQNPAQFADAVTTDLRSLNGDLHLGLRYSPPGASEGGGGGGGPDPVARNFGLGKVEILDGNVGYLEITGFMGAPGYREAVADALRLLSRTRALIIDVRRNGGGSGEMSHFVFSHFLGPDPVPTILVKRRTGDPDVRHSMAEVSGPRRTDIPLYVLTSRNTGSAAEEFSFVLRNQGRATIVGSRTAGAGHMVARMAAGNGFAISVSITRVMDPVTRREWEGVGVEPHLDVAPEEALDAAHAHALTTLRPADGDPTIDRLLETIAARRSGVSPDTRDLARLTGDYDGRLVTLEGGQLWYRRRASTLPDAMVPLGGDRFAVGAIRYSFEISDGRARLTIGLPDGTRVSFDRSGGALEPTDGTGQEPRAGQQRPPAARR